jgi:hypothetical protein
VELLTGVEEGGQQVGAEGRADRGVAIGAAWMLHAVHIDNAPL